MCSSVQTLNEAGVNVEFRLWLTSYPSDIFPTSILENGLKIVIEPPQGLKAGMERIYKAGPLSDPAFLDGCKQVRVRCVLYYMSKACDDAKSRQERGGTHA